MQTVRECETQGRSGRDEAVPQDPGYPTVLVEQSERVLAQDPDWIVGDTPTLYKMPVMPDDQTWKQGVACLAFCLRE